ncbi:hypothetical protein DH2020_015048 [Rehmannia glutinosa]|uniref:Uncharacterized protein n=1 Tax=Rehmannia glutinosa TaxID=99300 RepID=A0ABR0WY76_REHGL
MEECQKIDLEFEAHGLIDDSQFSGLNAFESAGALSTEKEVDINLGINPTDHLPQLHESMEPERNQKNGRYNLRKSLAWDSAFFTSAGVLDAEELSTMITGADKREKHLLPGIQEDITGSTESISSLGSDTLTLETLDDDLFVDIRASIQRSSKKASDLKSSNSKLAAAMKVDSAAISSLKKEDVVSENKIPKPGLKKTSSLQTVRMSKCHPKQNIGKLGSGKASKQDHVHSPMSMAKTAETNSIHCKPPKTNSSSIPSSTAPGKRDSVGTGRAKSECGISKLATVSGKGTQPPKVSSLNGPRRALPKPALPSKSSLSGSSITSRAHSTRSSTSSDSSSNMSTGTSIKPTLMTARRNPGKNGDVGTTGPSGSIPKTPSRATLKNKLPSSIPSAYLMSAKISSSVSPASSISEWSSASSSSSSMVNQKYSNSRTSLDTSSCRSMDGDSIPLDQRNKSDDRAAEGHGNHGVSLTSNNSKKYSTQAGNLHAPAKPSGLRMPSPKIGFFDGVSFESYSFCQFILNISVMDVTVGYKFLALLLKYSVLQTKSSARTPNGHQQSPSTVQNGIPKNGAAIGTPIRSSNSKPKSTKVPTARMASLKPSSPKVRDSPSLSPGVKGSAPKETCQEVEQVVAIIEKSLVTDKENGHDKYVGEVLTGDNKNTYQNVCGSINELLSDTTASELGACRAPLALKNSFCSDKCTDMPKELDIQVADKTGFLLPSSEQKENL